MLALLSFYRDTMNSMMEALLPPLLRLVHKDCKQPVVMQVGTVWIRAT